MKKLIFVLLCAVLALSLAGCGGGKTETPAPTQAPAVTAAPTEAPVETPTPAPTEAPAANDAAAMVEKILAMKGQPVADLYALVGQPLSSDYTSSCLGPSGSKDGQLEYDGFTVYTLLLPDGTESIYDCE